MAALITVVVSTISLQKYILCFVLDKLSLPDIASVEKAMGSYIDDAYWRPRNSTDLNNLCGHLL